MITDPKEPEAINHPSHYNQGKKAEDLKKAIWYLQRELEKGQR